MSRHAIRRFNLSNSTRESSSELIRDVLRGSRIGTRCEPSLNWRRICRTGSRHTAGLQPDLVGPAYSRRLDLVGLCGPAYRRWARALAALH